ncbi:NADPH:quinone reductase [Lentzea aerocolonigenes]|uniref:NADPH:quinone reductase n=1 Tax=Lentzea aerocolonigenes TaxID=68170 RepID=A0A0F0GXH5_LENAE|nr:zinc-dependent alcohol dehydrogenase family protein [Lentzea aerocolonigenes]KJK48164.1 NADPH:quinone reductase [Lentzea aerocolonigenes]
MAKHVLFDRLGGPEVLTLRDVEVGSPGPGEVRIRVDAIGLNRAEIMFREGVYYEQPVFPSTLGYEAAGVVEAVGEGVSHLAEGEPIAVVPAFSLTKYGTYGDHVIVPAHAVFPRPANTSAVQAAAVWMAYITAYGPLFESGEVRPGDHVLISAAASSVGQAAIQVARHIGAIPIATTRAASKSRRLLEAGAAEVVVTTEEDLVTRVKEITGGEGVRLAFDPIAGPGVDTIAQAIALDGHLVVYGGLDPRPTPLPNASSYPRLTSRTYTMHSITSDPGRLRRAVAFINAGLATGSFTPAIDRTFDLTEIAEAHRYLEASNHIGKIVVTLTH